MLTAATGAAHLAIRRPQAQPQGPTLPTTNGHGRRTPAWHIVTKVRNCQAAFYESVVGTSHAIWDGARPFWPSLFDASLREAYILEITILVSIELWRKFSQGHTALPFSLTEMEDKNEDD